MSKNLRMVRTRRSHYWLGSRRLVRQFEGSKLCELALIGLLLAGVVGFAQSPKIEQENPPNEPNESTIDKEQVNKWIDRLRSTNDQLAEDRQAAAHSLGTVDLPEDMRKSVTDALFVALDDKNQSVQAKAWSALLKNRAVAGVAQRLDTKIAEWIEMIGSSGDFMRRTRQQAAMSLGNVELTDSQRDRVIPALVKTLTDSHLKHISDKSLINIGESSVPDLSELMRDDELDWRVRASAVRTLGKIDLPEETMDTVNKAFLEALADENQRVQDAAREVLTEKRDIDSVKRLVDIFGHPPNDRHQVGVMAMIDELLSLADLEPELLESLTKARVVLEGLLDDERSEIRYRALRTLYRLLKKNPDLKSDRISLLMERNSIEEMKRKEEKNDYHKPIEDYTNSKLEDFGNQLVSGESGLKYLREEALSSKDLLVVLFAAETFRRNSRTMEKNFGPGTLTGLLPDLRQALANARVGNAQDPEVLASLTEEIARFESIVEDSSMDDLMMAFMVIAFMLFMTLIVGSVYGMHKGRQQKIERNLRVIKGPFGLSEKDFDKAEYRPIKIEMMSLDSISKESGKKVFKSVLHVLDRKLGLASNVLRANFPGKKELLLSVLDCVRNPQRLDELTARRNPIEVKVEGDAVVSTSPSELKALDISIKIPFALSVLSTDLAQRSENLRKLLAYMSKTAKLNLGDIQTMQADRKVPLITAGLVPTAKYDELMDVLRQSGAAFGFMGEVSYSLLSPQDKARLVYACSQQGKSLQLFDDFINEAVLDTLNLGDLARFSQIMNPRNEAEAQMKEEGGSDDPERRKSLEEEISKENARMIIGLLEIAAGRENARAFFNSRITSKLTDSDRESLKGGTAGLSPSRVREILVTTTAATKRAMG